jgi:hypothetical protein
MGDRKEDLEREATGLGSIGYGTRWKELIRRRESLVLYISFNHFTQFLAAKGGLPMLRRSTLCKMPFLPLHKYKIVVTYIYKCLCCPMHRMDVGMRGQTVQMLLDDRVTFRSVWAILYCRLFGCKKIFLERRWIRNCKHSGNCHILNFEEIVGISGGTPSSFPPLHHQRSKFSTDRSGKKLSFSWAKLRLFTFFLQLELNKNGLNIVFLSSCVYPEMEVTEIILAKVWRLRKLWSHSRGFFLAYTF